jgi:hypothetical protein
MSQSILYPNQNPAQPPTGAEPQIHFCFKCRWEGRTHLAACPNCRRPLFSQKNVRTRGVLLTFLGLFLTGFMGVIAFFVTEMLMSAAKDPRSGVKFNGDENMLALIYLIFGNVIAIGVTMTLAGLWQVVFARRNMVLIWLFFGLIIVTLFIGTVFRHLAG